MNILLGITGSIAAYKSAELARLFIKNGHEVKVVFTKDAHDFIHPNTFSSITNNPVCTEINSGYGTAHIELAKWADLCVIAPATASTIGKLASGIFDNLLTVICSATKSPIFIAPAMNKNMWNNNALKRNIKILEEDGYRFIHPTQGQQACGDFGYGRMEEPVNIVNLITKKDNSSLMGKKVLITSGSTREFMDPIRYIGNSSSGKMGAALAESFKEKGSEVIFITGHSSVSDPQVDSVIKVSSSEDMLQAVRKFHGQCDIFISVAAVSDFKFSAVYKQKFKKKGFIKLDLEPTVDILEDFTNNGANKHCYIIGFAAETEDIIFNAREKLKKKDLDLVVVNQVKKDGFPLGHDKNAVSIIKKSGEILNLKIDSKINIAKKIVKVTEEFF